VVVSVLRHPNLPSLAASRLSQRAPPVVVVEQSVFSRGIESSRFGWLKKSLHRSLYPGAAFAVAASRGLAMDLQESLGRRAPRISVIPNPCDHERIRKSAAQEPDRAVNWSRPTLVAVGRLEQVKAFDLLLDAFAMVRLPRDGQLLILGEGSLGAQLLDRARRLGIADRLQLLGFRSNPFAYMARANAVVVSSLSEGFSNVLVEAMTCGTPVVSTDCPHGPREVLQGGASGLLVPTGNVSALAEALERVLTDSALAKTLSAAGEIRARDFAAQDVARAYEALIEEASAGKARQRSAPRRGGLG
jgi:glycosyltransferase involved in cell wall biosynthesis